MRSDKDIGLYIKKLREDNNMSQEELASKLNVSRHTVSKWEQGVHINQEYFGNLSKVFKIDSELIKYTGVKKYYYFDKLKKIFKKNLKKIIILILIVILCYTTFISICFFNNYNTIKFYSINLAYSNDFIELKNSYFFRSKDKVILAINPIYKKNDKIDYIRLYYYEDEKKVYILESEIKDYIYFIDYNGYNEYLDFNNINEAIDNMFIEVTFLDGYVINCRLVFGEEYANSNIFSKKVTNITSEKVLDLPPKTEFNDKIKSVSDKIEKLYNNNAAEIEYQKKKYRIYVTGNAISINYNDNGEEITLRYTDLDYEMFEKSLLVDNQKTVSGYVYSITLDKCVSNNVIADDCNDYEKDFDLFSKIIDYVLKK